MTDPFLENEDGSLLEKEVKRLRLENRELRLTNTSLRARLAIATPTASVNSDAYRSRLTSVGAGVAVTNSDADHRQEETKPSASTSVRNGADTAGTLSDSAAGATLPDATSEQQSRSRRTRGTPSLNAQVSAERIQEAVQQVKKKLQEELKAQHKAAALEKAEKEQLKREFELFVSTTCEREAAYQLVYMQLYREMEEQKGLLRSAQAQLEEQRLQSVEMRKALEAAVAAATAANSNSNSGDDGGALLATYSAPVVESAKDESTLPTVKRQRTAKPSVHAPPPRRGMRGLPKDLNWSELAGRIPPAPSDSATQEAVASATGSSQPDSTGPRQLKIIAGGGALRNKRKTQYMKRGRDAMSETSVSGSRASFARRPSRNADLGMHVPTAPVFASASAQTTPNESSSTGDSNTNNKPSAAPVVSSSSLVHGPASAAVESLWRLLTQHVEATQGFLPLWQHLVVLRGPDRHTVLQVLVSFLVYMLSPDGSSVSPDAQKSFQPMMFASLAHSFTSPAATITVVATAIRLLTVQLEEAAQQERGNAEAPHESKMLLSSLFYRLCVATLCHWQVTDNAFEALEQWATAVRHLYGFQPALLQLAQYTNTTAAYHRTRLVHGWISYTAQCIFSQCFTASASSVALPAETAVVRWQELCDSIGWSTHVQPLERMETAAARCVATTRVGRSSLAASCAEAALLSLRLVVLYKGFDHMEQIAKLLEQPGVLPMALTKEIYAELVSLAVRDRIPFRTQGALHHALRLLREYLQEVAPERCTSAEHFVSVPRRSHMLAALALLRVDVASSPKESEAPLPSSDSIGGAHGYAVTATREVREACRKTALQWLHAQKIALDMVRQSPALGHDRLLLLRDTPLGRILLTKTETG